MMHCSSLKFLSCCFITLLFCIQLNRSYLRVSDVVEILEGASLYLSMRCGVFELQAVEVYGIPLLNSLPLF